MPSPSAAPHHGQRSRTVVIAVVLLLGAAALSFTISAITVGKSYDGAVSFINPWITGGGCGGITLFVAAAMAWWRIPGAAVTTWIVAVSALPFCGALGRVTAVESSVGAAGKVCWLFALTVGGAALVTSAVLLTRTPTAATKRRHG